MAGKSSMVRIRWHFILPLVYLVTSTQLYAFGIHDPTTFTIEYNYQIRCGKLEKLYDRLYYNDTATRKFYDWQIKNRKSYLSRLQATPNLKALHRQFCKDYNGAKARTKNNYRLIWTGKSQDYAVYRITPAAFINTNKEVVKTPKGYRFRVIENSDKAKRISRGRINFPEAGLSFDLPMSWRAYSRFIRIKSLIVYQGKRDWFVDKWGVRNP